MSFAWLDFRSVNRPIAAVAFRWGQQASEGAASRPARRLPEVVRAGTGHVGPPDAERNTFTQSYASKELDAADLAVALVGFLPGSDRRVTGTIDAVRDGLGHDGFTLRYSTAELINAAATITAAARARTAAEKP